MKRTVWLAALALTVLFLTAGCGTLMEESVVRGGVGELLPGVTSNGMQETTDEEGHGRRLYSFTYEGVTFTLDNYQYRESLFGTTAAATSNTYAKALYEAYAEELQAIAERNRVEIACDSDTAIMIRNEPSRFSELSRGVEALEEVCGLLDAYLPEETLDWFRFSVSLRTSCGKTFTTDVTRRGEADFAYESDLLRLNFADLIRRGEVTELSCTQEELDAVPVKTIETLCINGKQFVSDRYETRFVYNLRAQRYDTVVCFGTKLDYNGGVEDYLQREILETYYPDCAYTIEEHATTYRIGEDLYRVERGEDGLSFFCSGEELPIEANSEIDRQHAGASYYYWISLDDFALLMGMRVERVTDQAVFLAVEKQ